MSLHWAAAEMVRKGDSHSLSRGEWCDAPPASCLTHHRWSLHRLCLRTPAHAPTVHDVTLSVRCHWPPPLWFCQLTPYQGLVLLEFSTRVRLQQDEHRLGLQHACLQQIAARAARRGPTVHRVYPVNSVATGRHAGWCDGLIAFQAVAAGLRAVCAKSRRLSACWLCWSQLFLTSLALKACGSHEESSAHAAWASGSQATAMPRHRLAVPPCLSSWSYIAPPAATELECEPLDAVVSCIIKY